MRSLQPRQPLFLFCFKFISELRSHDFFQTVSRDGHIIAVRVHLNQLKVLAVAISVQEVIIEFQHPELCKLVHGDADLKWPLYCKPLLPSFQLIRFPNLFQITEVSASQNFVHLLLIFGEDYVRLSLDSFKHFPMPTIAKQIEDVGQHLLAFVHVSCAARLCHFLHKLGEDVGRLIDDRSIDGLDLCPMLYIPAQQRSVQQQPLCRQRAHQLLSVSLLSARGLQIIHHPLRYNTDWHILIVKEGAHLLKLRPQSLRDLYVHFCRAEPSPVFQALCQPSRCSHRIAVVNDLFLPAGHFSKHGG